MWLLYQVAMAGALMLAAPWLLLRRGRHYLPTFGGRLGGHRGPVVRGGLWIHAVSVGEVGVAATLARALPADLPLVVTTVTPTGQAQARQAFRQRLEAGTAAVAYLPFDLGFAVRRFLSRFAPRALVLVEGDYWPLVLRAARRGGLPVAVVNGRVGGRSFRRLRRLRPLLGPLFRPLFGPVGRFGVQTVEDGERLVALGVPPESVTVTGNLKFETPEPAARPELLAAVRSLARGRPIVVAGSTMAGEEAAVLEAHRLAGGGARSLLVLAPRHPERWPTVAALLGERGVAFVRRSTPDVADRPVADAPVDVLLLDTMGDLATLYSLATAAFVGGTLAPTGGHNPIEPARFSVPVVVGPSMDNFREIAEGFDAAAAWERVADEDDLGRALDRWLADPAAAAEVGRRGAALVAANRGALGRTLELLAPLLERAGAR